MSEFNIIQVSQSYVDQGTTEAMYNYQVATGAPTEHILSKQSDGNLTHAEMVKGSYRRVIIVRYTGSIREVLLAEYELFKAELAEGIYQPYEFTWALIPKDGLSEDVINAATVKSIVARVDGPLQQIVRNWFAQELPEVGRVVSLQVDPKKYISPLRAESGPVLDTPPPQAVSALPLDEAYTGNRT